jgi:hypothetical protein
MVAVPRVREYVKELSYHRYSGTSRAALQTIALRARRDGVRTAMLEHAPGTAWELHTDLTAGGVSAWERFAIAFCGRRENPDADGVYYQVNLRAPGGPKIVFTNQARFLRQYFAYVRRGAVRIGAATTDAAASAVAFRNANGGTVVVVRASRPARLNLAGLPPGRYATSWSTRSRSGAGPEVDVPAGGRLGAEIPDAGFLTIYLR